MLNGAVTWPLCTSSSPSDDSDVMDAPVRQRSPPSDCRPNDEHPLNLTKHKDRTTPTPGTPLEGPRPPSEGDSGPVSCPSVQGPADPDRPVPSRSRPSSFSLKTSPSKFLSSPADERRGWCRAQSQLDGWSDVGVGARGTGPTLQPTYDNATAAAAAAAAASVMLSAPSSVLDRVHIGLSHSLLFRKLI